MNDLPLPRATRDGLQEAALLARDIRLRADAEAAEVVRRARADAEAILVQARREAAAILVGALATTGSGRPPSP